MYAQAMDKARKEGRIQGDKFAFQEGDNKIRLVSEAVLHESEYQGKPTRKWVLYVIDRRDGQAKLCFMANKVMGMIANLQESEDWGFEKEMPYDINVRTTNAGKLEVEYSILPSPKKVALTAQEKQIIVGLKPIRQVVEDLRAKQEDKGTPNPVTVAVDDGEPPISDDDIKF